MIGLAFPKTRLVVRCRTGKEEPERRLDPECGVAAAVPPVRGPGPAREPWRRGEGGGLGRGGRGGGARDRRRRRLPDRLLGFRLDAGCMEMPSWERTVTWGLRTWAPGGPGGRWRRLRVSACAQRAEPGEGLCHCGPISLGGERNEAVTEPLQVPRPRPRRRPLHVPVTRARRMTLGFQLDSLRSHGVDTKAAWVVRGLVPGEGQGQGEGQEPSGLGGAGAGSAGGGVPACPWAGRSALGAAPGPGLGRTPDPPCRLSDAQHSLSHPSA